MKNNNQYCVIMAGGAGKRFWPVSRTSMPKQFIPIYGTKTSYLRHTYDKFARIVPERNIIVVTTTEYAPIVRGILPELPRENLLTEPYIRDTAPCLTYATYKILSRNPEATMVVTPADHRIYDDNLFCETISRALDYVSDKDMLYTFGTKPTNPDTSFGYLQAEGNIRPGVPAKIKTFTEKPSYEIARIFYESGEFYWNTGVFVWRAETIRKELESLLPLLTSQFEGWQDKLNTPDEQDFINKAYGGCEKVSIAYGVMEKTSNAWLIPCEFRWRDIGEWETYYNSFDNKDKHGNAINSQFVLSEDNENCLFTSSDPNKMIAVEGLKDYMVIDTKDVLLICPRDAGKYKEFISKASLPEFDKFK